MTLKYSPTAAQRAKTYVAMTTALEPMSDDQRAFIEAVAFSANIGETAMLASAIDNAVYPETFQGHDVLVLTGALDDRYGAENVAYACRMADLRPCAGGWTNAESHVLPGSLPVIELPADILNRWVED